MVLYMRNICIYTTNRSEYSKLRPILRSLQEDEDVNLTLLVSGSHLLKEYGESKNQIIEDGIEITECIQTHIAGDDICKTVETIGIGLLKLPGILKKIKPDIILCGFDRFDMFPFAIAASLMNICLVHLEGGEITGTLDEKIRHSISKLSNYHLVSTSEAKTNLTKMGEFPENIFITGCPRYDELIKIPEENDGILKKYDVKKKDFVIFCYHPVSSDTETCYKEYQILLNAIIRLETNIIFMKPNIDYGNEKLSRLFSELKIDSQEQIQVFNHIDIDDFTVLMKNCSILIGNSSAGIREACVFGTPVLNIGTRQKHRTTMHIIENVSTLEIFNLEILIKKINEIKNKKYESNMVFGNGNASENIIRILKMIDFKKTQKILSYTIKN